MAINYNLTIGSLGRKLSVGNVNNVVYEVVVSVNANSSEHSQFTYSCGGTIPLDISTIDEESFIPFEEVTQDTIIEWLLAKEGVEKVEDFSLVKYSIENIQQRINALQQEDSVSVGWLISDTASSYQNEEESEEVQEESEESEEVQEESEESEESEEVQEDILES